MNEVHKEQFWFPIDIYFLTVSKMLMYKTRLRANIHNLCSCRRKAARLPDGRKRDNYPTHRLPKGEQREHAWKQERLICHFALTKYCS